MSKLTDQLREVRIFNPWDFAGKGNVYIDYNTAIVGRGGRCATVQVIRPGYQTDPDGHWMNNGHKTFLLFGGKGTHKEKKEATLEAAKQWASERYGIKEWAKTPFGSWMDAEFVKARMAELKAKMEA